MHQPRRRHEAASFGGASPISDHTRAQLVLCCAVSPAEPTCGEPGTAGFHLQRRPTTQTHLTTAAAPAEEEEAAAAPGHQAKLEEAAAAEEAAKDQVRRCKHPFKHRLLSPCIDRASVSTGVIRKLNSKVMPPQLAKDVANLRKSKVEEDAAAAPAKEEAAAVPADKATAAEPAALTAETVAELNAAAEEPAGGG